MAESIDDHVNWSWHESAGAKIFLSAALTIEQPFPILYAKAQSKLMSLTAIITTSKVQRDLGESVFRRPPLSTPGSTLVEIISDESVSLPYPGRELIWQITILEAPNPITFHALNRVLEIERSSQATAIFNAQGDGPFDQSDAIWTRILESFHWDTSAGVALKFDGDEVRFQASFKKATKCLSPPTVAPLPFQLAYLQPIIDDLLSLDPQEIDESYGADSLHRLLRERTSGLAPRQAEDVLADDSEALAAWIEDNPEAVSAYFVIGVMNNALATLVVRRGE